MRNLGIIGKNIRLFFILFIFIFWFANTSLAAQVEHIEYIGNKGVSENNQKTTTQDEAKEGKSIELSSASLRNWNTGIVE